MIRASDALADRQQGGELIPRPRRIPRVADEVGEIVAVGQRVGVLGARHPLARRQQRGELIPRRGIPRLPGPVGKFGSGGQRVGVLGAKHPLARRHSAAN